MPLSYVGRFAPSPTGALHLGSLFTAVASYLHARQSSGEWLVRIDDIDPPREVAGAADDILRSLERYGLHWDRSVLFQSTRFDDYAQAAQQLLSDGLAFRCSCSRRRLREKNLPNQRYPGTCRTRTRHSGATAVRVRVDPGNVVLQDGLQGEIATDLAREIGDYIVRRRDGLPAYHLAAVLDDALQGVTTVVRGADLMASTAVHLHLQACLSLPVPSYRHLPVLVNAAGQKLSKQTGAGPVGDRAPGRVAAEVLGLLGLKLPAELIGAPPAELWPWAIERWDIDALRSTRRIAAPPGWV